MNIGTDIGIDINKYKNIDIYVTLYDYYYYYCYYVLKEGRAGVSDRKI